MFSQIKIKGRVSSEEKQKKWKNEMKENLSDCKSFFVLKFTFRFRTFF